jgi:hypothetical protein
MSKQKLLCLALLAMVLAGNANSEDEERDAILAVMEQAFDAIRSGNPDDARATQLAEGTSLSFRPGANGDSGELEMRMSTNEALLADETDNDSAYMERWTGDPTVMIRGPIAVVWGEYEFWINGKFSHCGIDSVDFAKVDGDWKIANWMWTVERENCPTDPSEPAK